MHQTLLPAVRLWDATPVGTSALVERGKAWLTGLCNACAVTLQDKQLKPRKAAQHHAWRFESGAYIEVTWDQYKAGLGNTVTVQTGLLLTAVL